MNRVSCNCIVCAQEFDSEDLQSIALSEINVTNFKVCQACFDNSNPAQDYSEVRSIVDQYLNFSEAKILYAEVQDILKSRDN